jgi:hypothetical protein
MSLVLSRSSSLESAKHFSALNGVRPKKRRRG